jgi:MoxR-like ATPase
MGAPAEERADQAETVEYYYRDDVAMAVNVALATERPLLVSGPSGCGKSTLAVDIARLLEWELEREVITSRTQAVELCYKIDHLRRLQDASGQGRALKPMSEYVAAGVLWRAFDPGGARDRRGSLGGARVQRTMVEPPKPHAGVVVLLDEIDKADPDVPNNLLEPLGAYRFSVPELEATVEAQRTPLLVITTNNERRLPDAFIRRCVEVKVDYLGEDELKDVALRHFAEKLVTYARVHPKFDVLAKVYEVIKRRDVSTAEYLDTVRAALNLTVGPADSAWADLPKYTVHKPAKEGIG